MPGPYSRVYHSVKDDERFASVYASDENFATWVRLLMEADAAFPAPAAIPRSCRPRPLAVLVNAGIVELLPGDLYRIHGMKAEREGRSEAGRVGGLASGRSRAEKPPVERPPNEPLNEPTKQNEPNQAEPSRDETNQAEPSSAEPDAFVAYHSLTGRFPVQRVKEWLNSLVKDHGDRAVEKALAEEMVADPTLNTLLSRTQNRLAAAVHERRKAADSRKRPPTPEEEAEIKRKRDAELRRSMGLDILEGGAA